jgi:PHP family Zn ribbon phosphoesterase
MKSILDPSFRYTASFNTDLSKTFARIRRDHGKDAEISRQAEAEALAEVSPTVRKTLAGR